MLYERRLPRSGRVLLALVDNRMQGRLEAHLWRERPRSRGGLYTEAGPHPGRTYLARWTAEECLVGASQLAGNLAVASWSHKDGCPANCLARNLEVTLVSEGQQGGRPGADAPGSGATAEAKAATRAVLARLYNAVGAAEARRFLQALHREHLALRPGKKEAA